MSSLIGYVRVNDRIMEIEVLDKTNINSFNAEYTSEHFKVMDIYDYYGNKYNETEISPRGFPPIFNIIYEKDIEYKKHMRYHINKDIIISEIIKFFPENKSGYRKEYYINGNLMEECYQHNGKINGEYKRYHPNGNVFMIINFINGERINEQIFDEK